MRTSSRSRAAAAGLGLTVLLLAAGCGALPDGARDAAEGVAAGLDAGDLTGTALPAQAQEELERITAHLGGADPAVALAGVEEAGEDGREAVLSWTWDLPGEQDWSYDARLPLEQDADGQWRARWSPAVVEPSLGPDEGLRLRTLPADRGDVTGAGGEVLVTERPVHRVGLDRGRLGEADPARAARQLAAALEDVVELDPAAYAASVEQAGPEAFVEAVTLREDDFRALPADRTSAVPGLRVVDDEQPLAPSRGFAPALLGSVGPATAEDLERSGGELAAGDVVGRGGVQEAFDDRLRGRPGAVVERIALRADGGPVPGAAAPLHEVAPVDGQPVALTLDRGLQEAALEQLEGVASPAAVVALRPSTGEVLAAADGPGSEGYPTALQGRYAPGSTFKVATALAMLREGDDPSTEHPCPPSLAVEGAEFRNAPSYDPAATGSVPLTEAMAQSCNTFFAGQHERVTQEELAEAAAALGTGMEARLGVEAFLGSIPDEEPPVQHAAALFGQGRTLVSPLSMAVLAASAADGGLVTPRLVATDGLVDDAPARPATDAPLTAEEAAQLRTTMRAVVTEGHLDGLRALSPDTAIGKTGTAEYGTEDPPRTHSWVIAAHEDLAVAVFVEDGDLGSVTGGPIALEVLRAARP